MPKEPPLCFECFFLLFLLFIVGKRPQSELVTGGGRAALLPSHHRDVPAERAK